MSLPDIALTENVAIRQDWSFTTEMIKEQQQQLWWRGGTTTGCPQESRQLAWMLKVGCAFYE